MHERATQPPIPSRRRLGRTVTGAFLTSVLAAASVSAMTVVPASATPAERTGPATIVGAGAPDRIRDSYIVTLAEGRSADRAAARLSKMYTGKVTHVYTKAVNGFSITMSEKAAQALAADPDVARVEADREMRISDTQTSPPSWGLDRVDQANLPLDDKYTYGTTASNVHAYIIDTGIRTTHEDFGGRAAWGVNTTSDGIDTDCHGHGTHVAGTVGGTVHGIAKDVQLVAVKVLTCSGSGSYSGVIAGVDWVTANAVKPAVANMSLGGPASQTLDDAITASTASGVVYAVAAGNESTDACYGSPARAPAAITVGATTIIDSRAYYSNYGTCLDIFAPGSYIASDWNTSDTDTMTISGTSMASPHVAGNAALIASANPGWTAEQIRDVMVADATTGVVGDAGAGSPNKLLRVTAVSILNDFSMALSSTSGTVKGASSFTVTVDTTLLKGDPQDITFSAEDLPAGTTATFSPASVTTGQSTTLTITTSGGTPGGIHPITVTATAPEIAHTAVYTLAVSSAQCQDGQKLVNTGFENGSTGWTAPTGVIGVHTQWPAHSGSANAVQGGVGKTTTSSLSQQVSLPDGCAQYTLDFWLQIDTDESSNGPWDTLKVQVLNAAGTSLLGTLATYDNTDGYSAPGYFQRSLDLSAYAGQDITLRFRYSEDWIWQTTFVLDDVTLNVV